MDKILSSAFDFFAYALPGACMVAALMLLDTAILSPKDLLKFGSQSYELAFWVAGAYLFGFAFNNVGRFLYKRLGKAIWPSYFSFKDLEKELSISEKYALIREYSPTNFKYVEIWNVFCATSHNMALACLFFLGVSVVKISFFTATDYGLWFFMSCAAFGLFFLFLHRAVVFYSWAALDIIATIKTLKLQEKAGLI
jgi:hypothetical protein